MEHSERKHLVDVGAAVLDGGKGLSPSDPRHRGVRESLEHLEAVLAPCVVAGAVVVARSRYSSGCKGLVDPRVVDLARWINDLAMVALASGEGRSFSSFDSTPQLAVCGARFVCRHSSSGDDPDPVLWSMCHRASEALRKVASVFVDAGPTLTMEELWPPVERALEALGRAYLGVDLQAQTIPPLEVVGTCGEVVQ